MSEMNMPHKLQEACWMLDALNKLHHKASLAVIDVISYPQLRAFRFTEA